MLERATVKCTGCEMFQFRPESNLCRRCKKTLPEGSVTSTTIIVLPSLDPEPDEIVPLRAVMREAAVAAVRKIGATTHAAKALGIHHARLKRSSAAAWIRFSNPCLRPNTANGKTGIEESG